jgi:hypothetical protein
MTSNDAAIGQAQAFRLAGFALAQAAWSVEDGEDLVPIGIAERDGQRNLMRFATEITPERLAQLYALVGGKVEPGRFGVLAFASTAVQPTGQPLAVLNALIVDESGDLIGSVRQAYQPARISRIPGRSSTFSLIGTPSPSDEIDIPGAREGILLGVMSHPEGERLFPELASFAREMIEASRSDAPRPE